MTEPLILEVFSDYVWPWCCFSTVRVDQVKRNYDINVRWRAFPLHPETPDDGITLEGLFAGKLIDIKKFTARPKQPAIKLGLPLGERKKTYNSRLAQGLAKWAEAEGRGDPFHEAVFRAYFVDGKNIGGMDELVVLVKSISLPEKKASSVLELRTFKEAVDSDLERSYALGMTGGPTFVVDRQATVGFQPYEKLEQFLKTCGVKRLSWKTPREVTHLYPRCIPLRIKSPTELPSALR